MYVARQTFSLVGGPCWRPLAGEDRRRGQEAHKEEQRAMQRVKYCRFVSKYHMCGCRWLM